MSSVPSVTMISPFFCDLSPIYQTVLGRVQRYMSLSALHLIPTKMTPNSPLLFPPPSRGPYLLPSHP